MYSDNKLAAKTLCAEAITSAADAAINTVTLLTSLLVAKTIVAICVLSPSSAIKTVPKIAETIFQSILISQNKTLLITIDVNA